MENNNLYKETKLAMDAIARGDRVFHNWKIVLRAISSQKVRAWFSKDMEKISYIGGDIDQAMNEFAKTGNANCLVHASDLITDFVKTFKLWFEYMFDSELD